MRVVVFEGAVGGHFLHYAGMVSHALASEGAQVDLVVAATAACSDSYKHHVAPYQDSFTVHPLIQPPVKNPLKSAWRRVSDLRKAIITLKPDRVYLPTADGLAQMAGALRCLGLSPIPPSTVGEILLMNGAVAYPARWSSLPWLRGSYFLSQHGWESFSHLNPAVSDWATGRGPWVRVPQTMPEPVETMPGLGKTAARAALGLPQDGTYVGMVGRIDHAKKGTDMLIQALAKAAVAGDVKLLLSGPAHPAIVDLLRQELGDSHWEGRVFLNNRVVSDRELLLSLEAMDLVVLPYRIIIGSSGVVTRAAAAGRPVLVSPGGWAQQVVEHFSLGWVLKESSTDEIARVLPDLLDKSRDWQVNEQAAVFASYHCIANFRAHWTEGYRRAQGLPPDPALVRWDAIAPPLR